jgi:hypothetical protein
VWYKWTGKGRNVILPATVCGVYFLLTLFNDVGFEVLTTVSTKMAVFWVVAPCSLAEVYQLDHGGSKDLWNVGIILPDYTALQPRRQPSLLSTFSLFSMDGWRPWLMNWKVYSGKRLWTNTRWYDWPVDDDCVAIIDDRVQVNNAWLCSVGAVVTVMAARRVSTGTWGGGMCCSGDGRVSNAG